MTESTDTAVSYFRPRYGSPVFDCGGAQVRAQCRHLAIVVTVSGAIDAVNVDRVSEYSSHFVLPDQPIVLNLSAVDGFTPAGVSFLHRIDEGCRAAGVEWTLVASPAVSRVLQTTDDEDLFSIAGSVREALHDFADAITARRRLLMPLLTKTA
ncbi:STAS domain-containing protein [Mycobacterium shimoidei]|uniref:Putative anti-anti-sigma factor [Mycobacterium tuberculosis H37Rv] n=1 Tax=Mycobacterium shimoidei TaxID=29313 RepID=A0A1E3TF56_MYCSH|nr:STAS domain-containing protein [Mycobacterium shimoidei]MCV7259134.1 STAS domain-containing protein [Mycobacterium shimoidei]ODR13064.1 sulfate transporter [Mycobacterium shimoidei]ORW83336.1 sulfate transporter [Mycobacterium shimoidei]SRX95115.1 putative anti-anti-sigma factor [Mycobacterium tuberculosis H37Rv] [Mycobacterium shimoidei]